MARFTYRLDSEGFAEFRKQWADSGEAGKAMIDEMVKKFPQLGDASEKAMARVTASRKRMEDEARNSFQSLQGGLDPMIAAQQRLAAGRETVSKAQLLGVASDAESANALRLLERQYQSSTAGVSLFSQGLGKANSVLAAFGVALSVGALVQFGKSVFDSVRDLNEQAEQVGVSVEALQAYRAELGQAGIKTEQVDALLGRFNRSLGEAATGTGKAYDAFLHLGLGASELAGGPEAVLPKTALALLSIKDSSLRAALEVELFGKTGQKLESALRTLIDPTSTLIERNKALGLVLGHEVTDAADKASDALARFWGRVMTGTAAGTYNVFHDIAGWLDDIISKVDKLKSEDGFDKARFAQFLNTGKDPGTHTMNLPGVPNAFGGTPAGAAAPGGANVNADILAYYKSAAEGIRAAQSAREDANKKSEEAGKKFVEQQKAIRTEIENLWDGYWQRQAEEGVAVWDEIDKAREKYDEDSVKAQEKAIADTDALIARLAHEADVEKGNRAARAADYQDYLAQLQDELKLAYLTTEERRVEVGVMRARRAAQADGQKFDEAAIRATLTQIQAAEKWTGVLTDIRGSMKNFWVDFAVTGRFNTKGLFDTIKADFAAMLYDMVIEAQLKPIMLSVVTGMKGGVEGIADLISGKGGSLSGINSLASLFAPRDSNYGTGAAAGAREAGTQPTFPSSVEITPGRSSPALPGGFSGGGGPGIGGYLGNAAMGYGIGSMNVFGGKAEGSAIGGALGAALGTALIPVLGPLGPILGSFAGSAIGGMFGPKPSNFTATAKFDASQTGASFSGDKPNEQTTGASKSAAQAIVTEIANLKGYGVSFTDTLSSISIGQRDRSSYTLGSGAKGTAGTVGDAGDLALTAIQAMLRSSTSSSPALQQVMTGHKFGSLEELDAAAKFVTQIYDATVAAKPAATQTETAMKGLVDAFKAASIQVKTLGLDITAFAAGAKKSFDNDIRGAILQIQDPLKYALELWQRDAQARLDAAAAIGGDIDQVNKLNALLYKQATDQGSSGLNTSLQGLIDSLNYGPGSANAPGKQYEESLSSYNAAKSKALASGSPADIQSFEGYAQSFLPIARNYLGTSEQYGAYVNDVQGTAKNFMSGPSSLTMPDLTPHLAAIVTAVNDNQAATNDRLDQLITRFDNLSGRMDAFSRRGGLQSG